MGFALAEKILSRVAGRPVHAGEEVRVKPDFVLAYASPGYTEIYVETLRKQFGIRRLPEPERFAVFIDHNIPNTSDKREKLHIATRIWCADQGVALYERKGIGHLVAGELGYAPPGSFVVHFDGHVAQLAAFGALAMGIRFNVLEAFAFSEITLKVPTSVRIEFKGKLASGVMARDAFHHLVGEAGSSSCRFSIMELGGAGLSAFSIGDMQAFTGLCMFSGAIGAVVNPTQKILDYALPRARKRLEPVWSDPDANYAAIHTIDLSEVEPVIVIPPSPANTRRLTDYIGMAVDVGYIGSCASGRIEDLRVAARMLGGRKVKAGFALNVVPSSNEIMLQADREGLLTALTEAGAYISSPTCSFCYGAMGALLPGQRAVSTGTLNVRGRMGSPDAEIYTCSAATVAATAIEGKVADPRRYL